MYGIPTLGPRFRGDEWEETKAKEATGLGKSKGYPLFFTTEPEE
jgi:hypothetical protein